MKEKQKNILGNVDQFIGKIVTIGNSSGIVIPKDNMAYSGLKEGDRIKVWYKKEVE